MNLKFCSSQPTAVIHVLCINKVYEISMSIFVRASKNDIVTQLYHKINSQSTRWL